MKNSTAENYAEKAAFFAHEIKNPLAVIKANVQLIELDNKGVNEKSFKTVYECIEKINGLIKENMEYIKNAEKAAESNVVKILKHILEKYEAEGSRQISFKSDKECVEVNCSSELLESLFENIIKNSVEATKDGDSISVEVKVRRKKAVIRVTDTGCGISEAELARVGELFYTTKKGGSGVGLFMCRRIVEQNGGKLKVENNRPKGTKVTVELNIKE